MARLPLSALTPEQREAYYAQVGRRDPKPDNVIVVAAAAPKKRKKAAATPKKRGMTKTERSYQDLLETLVAAGEIRRFLFEPVRLVLGPRVALLAERVRLGLLTPDRIRLAAFCGDQTALAAFACRDDDFQDGDRRCVCYYGTCEDDPRVWTNALTRFGSSVCVRAAWMAAARAAEDPTVPPDVFAAANRTLAPLKVWLDDPTEKRRRAATVAVNRSMKARDRAGDEPDSIAFWERPGMFLHFKLPEDHPDDDRLRIEGWAFFLDLAFRDCGLLAFGEPTRIDHEAPDWLGNRVFDQEAIERASRAMVDHVKLELSAWAVGP